MSVAPVSFAPVGAFLQAFLRQSWRLGDVQNLGGVQNLEDVQSLGSSASGLLKCLPAAPSLPPGGALLADRAVVGPDLS
jgi:hypothetical protein